jgi:hypothetical protein
MHVLYSDMPYLSQAVVIAHKFDFKRKIKRDMVEATSFPIFQRYNVRGVPRTVINETVL